MVLLDGRAERLILERPDPDGLERRWLLDDTMTARVASIGRGLGMAFLDAGTDMPQLTAPAGDLVEGAIVAARVVTPARRDKLAAARVLGPAAALVGRTTPPSTVAERLQASAPDAALETGREPREVADAAQDEALQIEHALPGGARLFIEPTRALIAVDVDVGVSAAGGDAKRRQRRANLSAMAELPRLLRLKGLAGVIAIDLVGKGHDGPALAAAAMAALAPIYGAAAAVGPISRFGVMQLQLPWLDTPIAELLLSADGAPTAATHAFALLRVVEREVGPGARVQARCAPAVFAAASPYVTRLKAVIGDRFSLCADPAVTPDSPVVRRL